MLLACLLWLAKRLAEEQWAIGKHRFTHALSVAGARHTHTQLLLMIETLPEAGGTGRTALLHPGLNSATNSTALPPPRQHHHQFANSKQPAEEEKEEEEEENSHQVTARQCNARKRRS